MMWFENAISLKKKKKLCGFPAQIFVSGSGLGLATILLSCRSPTEEFVAQIKVQALSH